MNVSTEQPMKFTIYPNMIVVSKERLFASQSLTKKAEIMLNNRTGKKNAFMSDVTKRRIKKILTTWHSSIYFENKQRDYSLMKHERRLTFCTLTLSDVQKHDDIWIKRNMLNRFIITLTKNHNVVNYFWRAEKMKNGRIHFHVIFDCYVSNRDVQQVWNNIQRDNDYLNTFYAKFNRWNAPSTHMESITTVDGTIDYVLKYAMKESQTVASDNSVVSGLIWGCSDSLKSLKPYSMIEDNNLMSAVNEMIEKDNVEVYEAEQFIVLKGDILKLLSVRFPCIYKQYESFYVKVYEKLYYPEVVPDVEILNKKIETSQKVNYGLQMELPFELNYRIQTEVSNHYDY